MSHIATDIHEKRFLGVWIPALRLLFKRILLQPTTSHTLLQTHVLYKSLQILGVLRKVCVGIELGVVCRLEDGGLAICNILVVILPQERWHFLEERTAVLEAVHARLQRA